NNRHLVPSYPSAHARLGTTLSKISGTSYDHTTENTVYTVNLDPDKGTAVLTISNFSVAVDNSFTAVEMKDLPYTFDTDGDLSLTADKATATLVGSTDASVPGMPVENLKMTINHGLIDVAYTITVDGTTYNVTCNDK
ncbi:MAG: hypothetical protein K2K84_04910, partial [Muribaculaceae bacterium]|nr:hypothetical protein [Muribaculaceae bacterium]